jgi:hypothetical protein
MRKRRKTEEERKSTGKSSKEEKSTRRKGKDKTTHRDPKPKLMNTGAILEIREERVKAGLLTGPMTQAH